MKILKNWRIVNALIWATMMIIVGILSAGASDYIILVMIMGWTLESMLLEKVLKNEENIATKNC